MELRIPNLRNGSYWFDSLEPRRRAEKARTAVMQEAYVQGISTRSVDELVQAKVPGLKVIVMSFLVSKIIIIRVRSSQADRLRHLNIFRDL